ncbi:MAG TPA: hypothetical protein VK603_25135, partial [Candidatus Saccharimonadales bacterium]|nr:hypothetical protein [Candidatus Saccharimonadales bacterium]
PRKRECKRVFQPKPELQRGSTAAIVVAVERQAMAEKLTISQLNKLGERLRKDPDNKDDLRTLDAFRSSFAAACERVSDELSKLGLEPVSRPAKTTLSIIAKLNRERSRLSKMQDIAGCRVKVNGVEKQDRVVSDVLATFPDAVISDSA